MLRRRNRRTEARELLREALDGANRSGAGRLAKRAETELRAAGARPRRVVLTGLESLTASERRIAELASQDLTNREIAQMLFITDRTVEGHLTSVFRKLRPDSRSELQRRWRRKLQCRRRLGSLAGPGTPGRHGERMRRDPAALGWRDPCAVAEDVSR
jgi:DNA-binding CsgD family transcriptional regulator